MMENYADYLAHGVSTEEYIADCGGIENAAIQMHAYITGEAATETATYDPKAAKKMRQTKLHDVQNWFNRHA